jgi:hypothetical protein
MTTSNEREAFREWFESKLKDARETNDKEFHASLSRYVGFYQYGFFAAWQHQQEIITNLEEKLQQIVADNVQLQAKCVLLEKQNTGALKALKEIAGMKFYDYEQTDAATEAFAEINRLQDKPAEGAADLLQSQASEARLREHIEEIWKAYSTVVLNGGTGFARHLPEPIQAAKKALSTPPNTAELESFVAKAVETEIESLQAKLTIAVNNMVLAKIQGSRKDCNRILEEAFAEINRLQDKPAEGA